MTQGAQQAQPVRTEPVQIPTATLDALAPSAPNVGDPGAPGGERVVVRRFPELPGVELWSATGSARLWTVHHATFAFCAPDLRATQHADNRWRYRGVSHTLSPTGTQLFEPGETHATTFIAQPVDFHVLFVDASHLANQLTDDEGRLLLAPPHLREALLADRRLWSRFHRLCVALEDERGDPLQRETALRAYLRRLFARVGETGPPPPGPSCSRAVERARAFIAEHATSRLHLAEIAHAAGVSKFHLERAFVRHCGLPVWEYVKHVRMARAMAMLRRGLRPAAVAPVVGFADQAHMTRVFRQLLGLTPGAYARAHTGP